MILLRAQLVWLGEDWSLGERPQVFADRDVGRAIKASGLSDGSCELIRAVA